MRGAVDFNSKASCAQVMPRVILLNICLVQELVEKSKGILLGIIKYPVPLRMLVPDDVVELGFNQTLAEKPEIE